MPDTLSRERLANIRWRSDHEGDADPRNMEWAFEDRDDLLEHIDALEAAVPEMVAVAITGLPNGGGVTYNEAREIGEKVLRTILRAES